MQGRKRQEGFSLVELAIVLIIIGLIVGGVLKGQDLINSARVNDVQTTLNKIRTATNTFQDKYVALPGDFDKASTYLGSTNDGDGDGRVNGANRVSGESAVFWAHLQQAGLLGSIDSSAIDVGTPDLNAADAYDASVGGFYTIDYETPFGSVVETHWLKMGDGADADSDNDDPVISPIDLRSVDLKGDDGDPTNGEILAKDGTGVTAGDCVTTGAEPDYAANEVDNCVAYFRL